jgi:site-specific DNA-methyltransferase (adenine-specific)
VICGHTRLKAAYKLGLTEVPVHIATGLTQTQARAYRIADNQTAALSQWDDDKLPIESRLRTPGGTISEFRRTGAAGDLPRARTSPP